MKHQKWSPERIAKPLTKESEPCLSHETIYKWIRMAKHSNHRDYASYRRLYKDSRHSARRQKRSNVQDNTGVITGRIGIENRPDLGKQCSRTGDIEVDLMMERNHKSPLLVITERATLVTMIEKLNHKNADEVYRQMKHRLTKFNPSSIKTIPLDNGKEFAHPYKIAQGLMVKTYFTRPYTSQNKGTVENRIGVLRKFSPKKSDWIMITEKRIKKVEKLINHRPIRKFNYNNPIEILKNKTVALMG